MSDDDAGRLAGLTSSLSVSVLGYNFLKNPEGFVLAVVYDAVVDAAVSTAGEIALTIIGIYRIFQSSVLGTLGTAIRYPFALIGGLILSTVASINEIAVSAAAAAGPFGFVVIPLVWSFVTIVTFSLLVGGFRLYKWFRTVVV